ncbi:BTB/POZ domain-containing protein 6-like [Haliotis cracherodii]|uniref:BTB/POZ domain-containing protein 6-like n=1 Tax=Haliotis cracherodii TaxID=6455 RepID=UPI0039E8BD3D
MSGSITRATTASRDWQTGKNSTECNRYMLEHQLDCDVTFEVGESQEIIRAHSYILKSRSQGLYDCLSSSADGNPRTLPLPETTAPALQCVLRYCYTDATGLTIETVIGVLHLSKLFNIGRLRDSCTAFIRSHLSDNNVCYFLEQAHHYQEVELRRSCLEFALSHGETVIKSDGFLGLCYECVELIISADSLHAKEVTVYKRVIDWGKKQLRQHNTSTSELNLRDGLGPLLFRIRFPLLGMNYFASMISHLDLLTDAEKVSIFRYLSGADRLAGQFQIAQRVGSPITLSPETKMCVRFSETAGPLGDEMLTTTDANRRLGLAFSCNRMVALRGVLLYRGRTAEYDVKVKLFSHLGDPLHEESIQVTTSEEHQQQTSLELSRLVLLEADVQYTLSVQTSSYSWYYGARGSIQIRNGNETFTFYECPLPSHSSSLSQGDLPGLLYTVDVV